MKDPPKTEQEVMKTFEDVAFEMLSTVSPVKLPREDIPFDSVREIVLNEIIKSKQQTKRPNGIKNMEEFDEAPSSSSSSSHVAGETPSSSSNLERGTMTEDVETAPRPIAARLYGDCTRSSSTSSVAAQCSSESTEHKKKPLNYREKRLAEVRQGRLRKYRENAEVVEFKYEENCLVEPFLKFYSELVEEDSTNTANVYFRIVESLDVYFRAKTWESNCPKLLCEFLCENILKSCQFLNELHDEQNSSDERRARECQIQVLLTLHVFVVTDEKKHLEEAIHKLRMIFFAAGPERLRVFVEEPVTDVYWELIGDSLATIYDELCISLPADLLQYENGLFKITETEDSAITVKRRNGAATRLEQMVLETSSELGVGGVERVSRIPPAVALAMEAPIVRRSLKRKNEVTPKELLSPVRSSRNTGTSCRPDYKQFFVEDTPDEKYQKRSHKKKKEESDISDDDIKTIAEEIEEEVKQTPVQKLRLADHKSGKRCSKRLSEIVKLSEERAQIPKRARENLGKILEKAKAATPLRSVRPTRKSVILGTTPTSSPVGMNTRGTARASLLSRFDTNSNNSPPDTSNDDAPSSSTSPAPETPVLRERTRRRGAPPARYRDAWIKEPKVVIKQEIEDPEYESAESGQPSSSSASVTPATRKWTDRGLKRQLGLTREDLNRYRDAMLTTGERSRNINKNEKINWESAQVNRAGRVKGAGASEDGTPIFGIGRRGTRTLICHVLLNDTNPDTNFDWNKVRFDDIDSKPRTRSAHSLRLKPEAFMESLKQKYIDSKVSPRKRKQASGGASTSSSPQKKRSSGVSEAFGFESEADD